MDFGIWYAGVASYADPGPAATLARAAEAAGFESLWAGEHVAVPAEHATPYPYSPDGKMPGGGAIPMAEPLVWYAYAAALTERIRFATGVLVVPQRNPLLLAKQVATLDRLAGGRFSLGVGIGWLREEFEVLGASFERRAERLEEFVAALRAIWSSGPEGATFRGEHVAFERLHVTPAPASGPVPIVVGGHTEAAARRAGRIGDGFFPAKGSPERIERLLALARESALATGRDAAALELTVADPGLLGPEPLEAVERWQRIGAARILMPPPSLDPSEAADKIAAFGEAVIARTGPASSRH